jgi:nucleotide sugar dehydrogenase
MAAPDVSRLHVRATDSVRDVMRCISAAAMNGLPSGIALLVDDDQRLKGVVTDGDIRRALLDGTSLDDPVEKIAVRDPIVFSSALSYRQILDQLPRHIVTKGRYRGGGVVERVILTDPEGRVERVLGFLDLWRNQSMSARQVQVIGMGYVGLTLALTMADAGYQVTGVERDPEIVAALSQGRPHIFEAGLEPLLSHHLGRNLTICGELPPDVDIHVLAVATPLGTDLRADLRQLLAAAGELGNVLGYGHLVIVRSTVPVGVTRGEVLPVLEARSGLRCGHDFHLAFAPERTIAGRALAELRSLPQVVGGFDRNSRDLASNVFREITPSIIAVESLEEAEMVKLVNNSFRDVSFAYANELVVICEHYGIDPIRVITAANDGYPRGNVPLPSPGVGGSCLKKDPHMFTEIARRAGVSPSLSQMGRQINEAMPGRVVAKVFKALKTAGKRPEDCRFFLLGLAFKGEPETSDMRESTSLDVIALLRPVAAEIRGYDAVVPRHEIEAIGVRPCTIEQGFAGADCAILLNNHRSHAAIDIYRGLASMNRPAVYCDCWGILSPDDREASSIEGVVCLGLSSPV